MATYTHLGNANNALCREAEKSVYKTCVSRASSPKTRLSMDKSKDAGKSFYCRKVGEKLGVVIPF